MANTELNVVLRDGLGKGSARSLRRQELIPAVVYGKGIDTCALTVAPKDLQAALSTDAGVNALITLKGAPALEGRVVILKDLQVDPLRGDAIHIDFQAIDLAKKVHVMVPIHPQGKSEGEKQGGGMELIRHELELICLPTAIPSSIDVDITEMQIGDVVHVGDLALPEGVELATEGNFTILTVTGRKAEEEEEAGEEAVEGEVEAQPAEEE